MACGLRTLALLLNFLVGQNLNYLEITDLRHIPFLGESVSVAEGVPNPWMVVGQLSLMLLLIFVADASVTAWRRGDRHQCADRRRKYRVLHICLSRPVRDGVLGSRPGTNCGEHFFHGIGRGDGVRAERGRVPRFTTRR